MYFAEAALEATATIGLVLLAGGATAAAFGRAIGYLSGALIGAAILVHVLGRPAVRNRGGGRPLRRIGRYAGALLIVDGAYALFSNIDVLLVGGLLGSTAAGIYGAPLKLSVLLHYPGLSIANAIAPRLASHPDHPPDVPALARGLRLLLIVQTALAVAIVVWATPIIELVLEHEYDESAGVLRALSPFVFLAGFGPLVALTVNYLGEARRRIPIAVGCLALTLVLALVLIDRVGVEGAAISVDVSFALYALAHLWICRQLVGLSPRPLALTAVRVMPAAAALAAVLVAAGTEDLGVAEWALGVVGGTGAFVVALVVTRETSVGELREAWERLSQRFRPA